MEMLWIDARRPPTRLVLLGALGLSLRTLRDGHVRVDLAGHADWGRYSG